VSSSNDIYYRGNRLLEHLSRNTLFFVPVNGTWIVLYADTYNNPALILYIYDKVSLFEENRISQKWFDNIPCGEIIIIGENKFAIKWQHEKSFQSLDSAELYHEFQKRNLVLSNTYSGKPFNSKASSRYHIWQSRTQFVGGITDIDLIRLDGDGRPIEIIEIKRSRISSDTWKPYFQDKGGYEILQKFCEKFSLDFSIIYYHFDPRFGIEDIQNLTLFRKKEGFNFERIAALTIDDFVHKNY